MAKESVRSRKDALAAKGKAADRTRSESAPKKHAKKHTKKAAKHAMKKAAKHVGGSHRGLDTAFHHMQRASVVISLMEKGTGGDLRDLLKRGVSLYRSAAEGEGAEETVLQAIGVLRAAEHLSLAGLYAARERYGQKVQAPELQWLEFFIAETDGRLDKIAGGARGEGVDLFPVSVELLRQADEAHHDAHLAYELAMAADALCFALENGL